MTEERKWTEREQEFIDSLDGNSTFDFAEWGDREVKYQSETDERALSKRASRKPPAKKKKKKD